LEIAVLKFFLTVLLAVLPAALQCTPAALYPELAIAYEEDEAKMKALIQRVGAGDDAAISEFDKVYTREKVNYYAEPCMTLKDGTFEALGDCARRDPDGSYAIDTAVLRLLDFNRWGLATLSIGEEGYAYVRRDGRALLVPTFDNWPDEFIDGLVRVRIGEKHGYADRRLRVVIPAIYDGTYRFSKGRARACLGCVTVSDGEHSWYSGGQPVCLDRRGGQRDGLECVDL
jgi:hypothetical protein